MGTNTLNDVVQSQFFINNLKFIDVDYGVDLIRVIVNTSAQIARLSINTTASSDNSNNWQNEVFFHNTRYCTGSDQNSWICSGDFFADNVEMSFVSTVRAAQRLVNSLVYTSIVPNIHDVLSITVLDGVVR